MIKQRRMRNFSVVQLQRIIVAGLDHFSDTSLEAVARDFRQNGVRCPATAALKNVRRGRCHVSSGGARSLPSGGHTQMPLGFSEVVGRRDGRAPRKHLRLRHSQSSFERRRPRCLPSFGSLQLHLTFGSSDFDKHRTMCHLLQRADNGRAEAPRHT